MKVWRYFGIGDGLFLPYVNTSFKPAVFSVSLQFSKTEQMKRSQSGKAKARSDRILQDLFFCGVPGCREVFER